MTATAHHDSPRARAVDRLCELANIGAGHAAGALATLCARPFVMGVPVARVVEAPAFAAPFASDLGGDGRSWTAVSFEVRGGPGGVLSLLIAPPAREALLSQLLGESAGVEAHAESALSEVGNIVASHALSAIGDLLHAAVLPSPPRLALTAGARAFNERVASLAGAREALLRIEVELSDRAGAIRALLVWVPAKLA